MSKRCSAKNCFNCVLYNKNIAYFSFPRHREFAQRWAELAGRNDLKDKPLSRIVKYYLCAEHFTANCFLDKDTRKRLKRSLPYSIAFPSIFKNNLQETLQNANPSHSIEVHNIVLLDVDERVKDSFSPDKQSSANESASGWCSSQSNPVNMPNDYFFTHDDFESQSLDDCLQTFDCDQEKTLIQLLPKNDPPPIRCRLCSKKLPTDKPMVQFQHSSQLKEFIQRVMYKQIALGDSMSQVVCKNCENNAILCLIIIQEMDTAQKMFSPGNYLTTSCMMNT